MAGDEDDALIAAVMADPRYRDLVARRERFGWLLSAVIFFAFMGYLVLVAFDKALLGMPIGAGVTSIGIPIGIGLIVFAIALTGLYVARANRRYDAQMDMILRELRR